MVLEQGRHINVRKYGVYNESNLEWVGDTLELQFERWSFSMWTPSISCPLSMSDMLYHAYTYEPVGQIVNKQELMKTDSWAPRLGRRARWQDTIGVAVKCEFYRLGLDCLCFAI